MKGGGFSSTGVAPSSSFSLERWEIISQLRLKSTKTSWRWPRISQGRGFSSHLQPEYCHTCSSVSCCFHPPQTYPSHGRWGKTLDNSQMASPATFLLIPTAKFLFQFQFLPLRMSRGLSPFCLHGVPQSWVWGISEELGIFCSTSGELIPHIQCGKTLSARWLWVAEYRSRVFPALPLPLLP